MFTILLTQSDVLRRTDRSQDEPTLKTALGTSDDDNNNKEEEEDNSSSRCFAIKHPFAAINQKIWLWTTMNLSHFATDYERKDLISIGASCGFAASFGAPIGGLLFILDDISSHLTKDIFFRTLVVNAIGTFLMAIHNGSKYVVLFCSINELFAILFPRLYLTSHVQLHKTGLSNYSAIGLQASLDKTEEQVSDRFIEIPLYMLVGIGGGILGGFFLQAVVALRKLRRYCIGSLAGRHTTILQLAEVMILSLITSTILFYLPVGFLKTCKEIGHVHAAAVHAKAMEPNIPHLFYCQPGEINEIATLLLGSRNEAIKRILADPSSFERMNLFVIGSVFYLLMIFTFGASIPSGIFTPVVLSGSSFGGVLGDIFKALINPKIHPSTFAIIGVAALLAGIQRSTVSICVILVEATGMYGKLAGWLAGYLFELERLAFTLHFVPVSNFAIFVFE